MVIGPKIRGFICTTAHPAGCAENIRQQAAYARSHSITDGPRRVLVIGSSTGYGLACRVTAAFGSNADTIGVYFDRPSSGSRTATAGWYNNLAFEKLAKEAGLVAESINGDAFSNQVKVDTIELIKCHIPGGQVDLIIYSLASPKRCDPVTGQVYSSVIKPIGGVYTSKTVDFHTGIVSEVEVAPANEQEISDTVAVMGGSDWLLWAQALNEAGVLAKGVATVAFSYIGPSLTHPVYKDGTIGRAKEDLDEKATQIDGLLAPLGGKAFVSVNKALVTQASSAIPVVPLYMSLLFKLMKAKGSHEDCTEQMVRMFAERLYPAGAPANWSDVQVDEAGKIRLDDWEMLPEIQNEIDRLWKEVTTENLEALSDIQGYRDDFHRLFGFGLDGVDYAEDIVEY